MTCETKCDSFRTLAVLIPIKAGRPVQLMWLNWELHQVFGDSEIRDVAASAEMLGWLLV